MHDSAIFRRTAPIPPKLTTGMTVAFEDVAGERREHVALNYRNNCARQFCDSFGRLNEAGKVPGEKKAFPRRKPERDGRSREGFRHKHGRGLGENGQWVFVNNHSRQSTVRQCERTQLRTGSSRLSDCYICNRSGSPVEPAHHSNGHNRDSSQGNRNHLETEARHSCHTLPRSSTSERTFIPVTEWRDDGEQP
jgi:hypothetical protein